MGLRLQPADEYTHDLGRDEGRAESMYCSVVDRAGVIGGFFRLANRPGERRGEMTCCLWLPSRDAHRPIAFMFSRPETLTNDGFDAAGMSFDVVTPFERLEVAYDGKVVLLDDPAQLGDPHTAFTANPWVDCELRLRCSGLSPTYAAQGNPELTAPAGFGQGQASGHYEQLVAVRGVARVGHREYPIDGFGLRDHSWGDGDWRAAWCSRRLSGNVNNRFGFRVSRLTAPDGADRCRGFLWDGGDLEVCDDASVSTEWRDDRHEPLVVTIELRSGARTWRATGHMQSVVPLRSRPTRPGDQTSTRVAVGLTRWELDDGRAGWGLAEYLDRVVAGMPVGGADL